MPRNNMDVLCLLQEHGAILEGHFVMPSGFHSQTYIQTSLLMQHPNLAQKIAGALVDKFTKPADVVMALTPSDSVLAQEVARVRGVRPIFASKDDNGQMILKHSFNIKEGENVLIVDRSMGYLPLSVPLRSLLSYPMQTFTAKECPLCAAKLPITPVEEVSKN